MGDPIQKLRKYSIVFNKSGILTENWKFDEVQLSLSKINFTEISHTFPIYKRVCGIIFIYLFRSGVISKNLKKSISAQLFLYFYE